MGAPAREAALPPVEPHAVTARALAPTVTIVLMRILVPLPLLAPAGETRASHIRPTLRLLVRHRSGGCRVQPLPPALEPLKLGLELAPGLGLLALVLLAGQLAQPTAVVAPRLAGVRLELAESLDIGCRGRQDQAPSLNYYRAMLPLGSVAQSTGCESGPAIGRASRPARGVSPSVVELLRAPIATAEFMVVDTETNGLASDRCEMTEVG